MLPISRDLAASAVVYDCMDELASFRFASPDLPNLEAELLSRADLVFAGGRSLFEAKRKLHPRVYLLPSSVDFDHFAKTRALPSEPKAPGEDLRVGYYGVIDERIDLNLLAALAKARPNWRIDVVGPLAKIEAGQLPQAANLHYPGPVSYAQLPQVLESWDVAMMPFAINAATQFISPTKTPEYLAGGRPVVSTPITDVQQTYAGLEAVRIAHTPAAFVAACEAAAAQPYELWRDQADALLAETSWDRTCAQMLSLLRDVLSASAPTPAIRPSRRRKAFDDLIVGAGFAGAVLAERLAAGSGRKVRVIDQRPHIAGNAFDTHDSAGLLIHQYGPHIFHANSDEVFAYLSRFTRWRPYQHRVLASVRGKLAPIPINRTTLNLLFDAGLSTEAQAEAFLAARAEPVEAIRSSEDVVVSTVGRELYETFFKGYTTKQWGLDPSQLDKSVTARIPVRFDTDDRYFTDRYQAMPAEDYTRLFENMLDHDNITVETGVTFADAAEEGSYDRLVYTGPIDAYFDHRFGELPYRSLRFEHRTLDQEWSQPVGVVNYPDPGVPYTRITEYKHLTGQVHPKTSITLEHPMTTGDPYYPVPRSENQALYKRYEALALKEKGVIFAGRLATYRYYNMDQVVGQALSIWRKLQLQPTISASDHAALQA
jgi:UDP-galactopyranose mutase